jgi:alpha-glucosidase
MKKFLFCFRGIPLLFFCWLVFTAAHAQTSVQSPDGTVSVTVNLIGQQLSYTVEKSGNQIMSPSPLGILTSVADFRSGLTFVSSSVTTINETYTLPSGKKSVYNNHCKELTIQLSKGAAAIHVIVRAYNDGFAYRYYIPGSGSITVSSESSGFAVNAFDKSWAMKYKNSYEEYFPARDWTATTGEAAGFCMPVLIKNTNNNIYSLITEAANYGTYAVSKIRGGSQTGLFTVEQVGSISGVRPLETPWRAVIVGDLPTIVESVMIENLNPPTESSDISWIKPGRASWDWGGEEGNSSNATLARAQRYIDLASSMGWEYYMQDEGWKNGGFGGTLQDLVNYGNSKGVGILLWADENNFANDENNMRTILQGWKNAGIKGIKIDFWEDDAQPMIQKYDKMLKVADELELIVNLHGSTKPSGIRRRWPHLLTSEGVFGGEQYLFNTTVTHARHNISLTLTRNVIGPMDYTPIDFANRNRRIKQLTTMSHQLALGIVYESGIQHINDSPDNLENFVATDLLKRLPATWDEIKCLEASPDQYITIARRKGDEWYVGALCDDARTLNLDLSFLNSGVTYYANIYKDGACDAEIMLEQKQVSKGEVLSIPLRAHGGVSIHFSTVQITMPEIVKYEAEASENVRAGATITNDARSSNGKYVGFIGNANKLTFKNVNVPSSGSYILTLYYMTGEARNTHIKVNEQAPVIYSFASTDGYNGDRMGYRSFTVDLTAGDNSIEFGNASGWCVNIDRITITKTAGGEVLAPIADGVHYIQNRNSSLYMDVTGSSPNDGIEIQQQTLNNQTNQQFDFEYIGNGNYKITAVHSGKAWHVEDAGVEDGKKLLQSAYTAATNQLFKAIPIGDGFFKFVANHSTKIMDVAGGVTTGGASIQQSPDNGQLSGHWKLGGSREIGITQASTPIAMYGEHSFGSIDILSSSAEITFTILNSGFENLVLTGTPKVVISGVNASEFTVITDASSPILAGQSTTFKIKFTPTSSGTRTARVTIASNDTDEGSYVFNISGQGVKLNQTITFGALVNKTFNDPAFGLAATAGSGLAVSYTSSNTAVATVSGNIVTIHSAGTTTIIASQAGNDVYNAAGNQQQTLTVNKATQSITFNALADKVYGGGTFDLAATASSGLAVSYSSSNTAVATVSGNTVTIVGGGTTTITASQVGNVNYEAAPNAQQPLLVNKASQTIMFGDLADKNFSDPAFMVSATASSELIVTYSVVSGPATVSGNTVTLTGALGEVTIKASQAGNDNYESAPDVIQIFTVICQPSAPSVTAGSHCGPGPVILSASGTTDGNYKWYEESTGGSAIAGEVNSVYTTPSLLQTKTYYVSRFDTYCESDRVPVDAEIRSLPPVPVVTQKTGELSVILESSSTSGNQWFRNGETIAGATNQVFQPQQSGAYSVKVTSGGCVSSSVENVLTETENTPDKIITVYPNPVAHKITVTYNHPVAKGEVRLYDVAGKVKDIKPLHESHAEFNVSECEAGFYTIEVHTGKQRIFKKIIKISN